MILFLKSCLIIWLFNFTRFCIFIWLLLGIIIFNLFNTTLIFTDCSIFFIYFKLLAIFALIISLNFFKFWYINSLIIYILILLLLILSLKFFLFNWLPDYFLNNLIHPFALFTIATMFILNIHFINLLTILTNPIISFNFLLLTLFPCLNLIRILILINLLHF